LNTHNGKFIDTAATKQMSNGSNIIQYNNYSQNIIILGQNL